MQILDTSAFIHEYHTDEPTASVPQVQEELTGEHAFRFDAEEGAGMHIHIPSAETVEKIGRSAAETGDDGELSETDITLIAAAFELDGTLVTDDYAMQNVADRLNVDVQVIAQEGITEQRDWIFQCVGCGTTVEERLDRCQICGSELTRKNPS